MMTAPVPYRDFRGYIQAEVDEQGKTYFVIYLAGVGHIFVDHSGALAGHIGRALSRTIS